MKKSEAAEPGESSQYMFEGRIKYSTMNLCLFDAQPEATKLWQELASLHSLQLNVYSVWNGVSGIPDATQILIIDQSAIAQSFENELLQVCRMQPQLLVLATGSRLSVQAVVELMRGGVSNLIEKPFNKDRLATALPEMLDAARELQASREEFFKLSQLFSSLTARERNVLDCVLAGVSNKDTAKQLQVSVRTVESRRAKVYRKLELKHVAELVRKMDRLEHLHAIFDTTTKSRINPHLPRMHLQYKPAVQSNQETVIELDAIA